MGLSKQPFIYFPHSPILRSKLTTFFLGNLVNTGEIDTCVWAQHEYQDCFSGTEATDHREYEHLHCSQATHTYMHTNAFSFCGFAKWFFIDSIDWAFPSHLSSSGISCAAKQYGSLPPGQEIFGRAHWSESTTPSSPAINQRRINGFTLPGNVPDS